MDPRLTGARYHRYLLKTSRGMLCTACSPQQRPEHPHPTSPQHAMTVCVVTQADLYSYIALSSSPPLEQLALPTSIHDQSYICSNEFTEQFRGF
jgi:hypothetical protein